MIFTIFISALIIAPLLWVTRDSYRRMKEITQLKRIIPFIVLSLIIGITAGYWIGFEFEYQVSETTRIFSAPWPTAFLKKEGDNWTDFVVPAPYLNAFLNLFIITLTCLIPVNYISRKLTTDKKKET